MILSNKNNHFPDTNITYNWYTFVMEVKCTTVTRYWPSL